MTRLYRLPPTPGNIGGFSFHALLLSLAAAVLLNWAGTQYIAHGFGYHVNLGEPLFSWGVRSVGQDTGLSRQRSWVQIPYAPPLYAPFRWAPWTLRNVRTASARPLLLRGDCIALSSLLIAPLVFLFFSRRRQNVEESADLHGSARWADKRDVKRTGLLRAKQGVYVGGWQDGSVLKYLRHNGPDHVLLYAPSGSGKNVGPIFCTLLGAWQESAVIYDIKRENWDKTAGFRSSLGPVFRFSPTEHDSTRFNPLAEIRLGTEAEIKDVMNITLMLTSHLANHKEPHWHETAGSMLEGMILHACYVAARERRQACLADVGSVLNDPNRSIRDTLREMMQYPHLENGQTHGFVQKRANEMLEKEDREFAGVHSTAKTAMKLFEDPMLARHMSASDFKVNDLVNHERPISLYIVVPPSDALRLRPIVRLLFTIIISRLTERLDGAQNRWRLLLLIDEFPSLQRMDVLANAISYMRGYGLKAFLVAQDIRQIRASYGNDESITSNCNVAAAFAPNTQETAVLLSDMLGKQTVQQQQLSFGGGRFAPMLAHVNASLHQVQRPLLWADEVRRLRAPTKEGEGRDEKITAPGQQLVIVNGHRPILGTQMLYFLDPVFMARSAIASPTDLMAIEDGQAVPQRPLGRTPHVISRVEVAPDAEEQEEEELQFPV